MSSLLHSSSGQTRFLAPRSLIGRSAHARIRSTHPRVSQEHALLRWSGGGWVVRDLGSRNGTWLAHPDLARAAGPERLMPGSEQPLLPGTALLLGDPAGERWSLLSGAPPVAFAVHLEEGIEHAAVSGLLSLPPAMEVPRLLVYRTAAGDWLAQQGGDEALPPVPVQNGEQVEANGLWRIHLPDPTSMTTEGGQGPLALDRTQLVLEMSRTENLVRLALSSGEQALDLGYRRPWILLWVLGLKRVRDRELAEHDQGWLDLEDLAHRADMEPGHVDVNISRIRSSLAEAGLEQAAQIVVARARPRQRRIGVGPDRLELRRSG